MLRHKLFLFALAVGVCILSVILKWVFLTDERAVVSPVMEGEVVTSTVGHEHKNASRPERLDTDSLNETDNSILEYVEDLLETMNVMTLSPEELFPKLLKPEIEELRDPPDSVLVRLKQNPSQRVLKRSLSMALDADGQLWHTAGGGLVVDLGELNGTVIKAGQDQFTIQYLQRGGQVRWRMDGEGPEFFESKEIPASIEYTFKRTGEAVAAVIDGKQMEGKCPIPFVVFPDGPIKVGDKWRNVSAQTEENFVDVEVRGFVRLAGFTCIVLELRQEVHQGPICTKAFETRYVDVEDGITIRSDTMVEIINPMAKPVQGVLPPRFMRFVEQVTRIVTEPAKGG